MLLVVWLRPQRTHYRSSRWLKSFHSSKQSNSRSHKTNSTVALEVVVEGKVYTAQGHTAAGEEIYFGMELIDEKNCKAWQNYHTQVSFQRFRFIPYTIEGEFLYPEEVKSVQDTAFKSFLEGSKKQFASWTQEKLDRFREALCDAAGAVGTLKPAGKHSYWIAYVSKTPVIGYFQHPTYDELGKITSTSYYKGYQDLLMSVRSIDVGGTMVYNNRGIFRSLISAGEGGNAGISLSLQAFTALVANKYWGKTHMSVAALHKMYTILSEAVDKEAIVTAPNIPKELCRFFSYVPEKDIRCVVKCDALIKCLAPMIKNRVR